MLKLALRNSARVKSRGEMGGEGVGGGGEGGARENEQEMERRESRGVVLAPCHAMLD